MDSTEGSLLPRVVLVDANVLFAPRLCDLFVHLHIDGVIRIHWSAAINDEWTRNAAAKTRGDPAGIQRRLQGMIGAVPDWEVSHYDRFIDAFAGVDAGDRHVSAAALALQEREGHEVVLVTENLKHFPLTEMSRRGVQPMSSSEYLHRLFDEDGVAVLRVAEACRTKLRAPPRTREDYVAVLMTLGCDLAYDLSKAWKVTCPVRLQDGSLVYLED